MYLNVCDDELSAADFDKPRTMNPNYRYWLAIAPACNDPDHPGCDKCWETIEEPEDEF